MGTGDYLFAGEVTNDRHLQNRRNLAIINILSSPASGISHIEEIIHLDYEALHTIEPAMLSFFPGYNPNTAVPIQEYVYAALARIPNVSGSFVVLKDKNQYKVVYGAGVGQKAGDEIKTESPTYQAIKLRTSIRGKTGGNQDDSGRDFITISFVDTKRTPIGTLNVVGKLGDTEFLRAYAIANVLSSYYNNPKLPYNDLVAGLELASLYSRNGNTPALVSDISDLLRTILTSRDSNKFKESVAQQLVISDPTKGYNGLVGVLLELSIDLPDIAENAGISRRRVKKFRTLAGATKEHLEEKNRHDIAADKLKQKIEIRFAGYTPQQFNGNSQTQTKGWLGSQVP
jgi:hypothetical protein